MSANCARPGCGHIYLGHDDERETGRPATGHAVVGCLECECAQYRTAEQQQAWDEARLALGPAVTEVPARVVKRLLELYP